MLLSFPPVHPAGQSPCPGCYSKYLANSEEQRLTSQYRYKPCPEMEQFWRPCYANHCLSSRWTMGMDSRRRTGRDTGAVQGSWGSLSSSCEPTVMKMFQTLTANVAAKSLLALTFEQLPGQPWVSLTSPIGRTMDHPLLLSAGMGQVNDAKLQKFQ